MADLLYLQCPHCLTQYTPARCGLPSTPGTHATIHCGICGEAFDMVIESMTRRVRGLKGRFLGQTEDITTVRSVKRGG